MAIEKYLILNKYLLSLFGVSEFQELQEKLKNANTGEDVDGRSYFINILRSLEGLNKEKLSESTLLIYDENIRSYVKKINYKREPITLKYFQYLSVLFTEILFDNLKNRKIEFLFELNNFLKKYKQKENIDIIDEFSENDLNKIAYWMATGSGKTLIMHINFYQFFFYNLFSPDNIILITPNNGLSKQHFEELQKSGIPCRLYAGDINSINHLKNEREILILEITKLIEEKKGKGVSISINTFEGKNLIFVDEGHKGKKSEEQKWAERRNKLAENGFVFEYSATFGQILNEKNKETLKEYAKSIIFDYSYKYFYLDGYGKDFSVINVKKIDITEKEFQEIMFIANVLSFYEQVLVYENNKKLAKEYNLEKPLWIFVGTTVTGKKESEESDIVQIIEFFQKLMRDENWFSKKVEEIISGRTGLKDDDNNDIFDNKFEYLKENGYSIDDIYKKIFGGKGNFYIYELKNAEGEFGIKVGENDYFGVINIGKNSGLKKKLEKKQILVISDVVRSSLFDTIKSENSSINILIGAKKFMEGWDTWRVSCMGLLNIGKSQGPQIIQLFGRGVRLKGKNFSLMRSNENILIRILETLNIYGIRADYLSRFLEAIRKEEVEFETIEIPIKTQHEEKWNTLYTLSKSEGKNFSEDRVVILEIEKKIDSFTIDLLPKIFLYLSRERKKEGLDIEQIKAEIKEWRINEDVIDLLDWENIIKELYNFKLIKGYWNLVLDIDVMKNFILSDKYKIFALPEVLDIKKIEDIKRIEEIVILILKKYISLFYRRYAKLFEMENLKYDYINKQGVLFVFDRGNNQYKYKVQIEKKEQSLIKKLKSLSKDLKLLLKDDPNSKELPRVYFDKHLYVPILLQNKKIKINPAGLVDSERKFLFGLRQYLKDNKDKFENMEIYLLRNFPKSGVGFFNLSEFYPDFIMWVKNRNSQHIVFIDPKGLEHSKELDNEKIKLFKDIKEIEEKLNNKNIKLESFILSVTDYKDLIKGNPEPPSKEVYIAHNVLFLSDSDWPEQLFRNRLNLF